jgi:hypothetical protein
MDELQDENGDDQQNMDGFNDGAPNNSLILNVLSGNGNSR